MGPRIEYEDPLTVRRPDKVAQSDKIRRESRKRKFNADQKEPGKSRNEEKVGEAAETVDSDAPQDLGKRVDLEA
jgi:hypothetical protein